MLIQETITAFKSNDQGKYAYLYDEDLPIPEGVNFYPLSMPPAIIYTLGLFVTTLFPLIAAIQGFGGRPELFVVAILLSIPFGIVLRLYLRDKKVRQKIKEGKQGEGLYATGDALILYKSNKVTFFPYEVIQKLEQKRHRGNNSSHYCTLNVAYLDNGIVKRHLLANSKKFDPMNVDSNFDELLSALKGKVSFEVETT